MKNTCISIHFNITDYYYNYNYLFIILIINKQSLFFQNVFTLSWLINSFFFFFKRGLS